MNILMKWIKTLEEKWFGETGLFYINGSDTLPPPLSSEREQILIDRLPNDESAKRELIEHNLRLVVFLAKKFENTGFNIEDLISIGTIGLIKAVNTFCAGKNIKLATYASRCIENEILMVLRKNAHARTEVSFEDPLNTDGDGNELLLADVLGTDCDSVSKRLEDKTETEVLNRALAMLDERERKIMSLRFGIGTDREYTQFEVAEMMGISQSYISRLEKKILAKLKQELEKMM